MLKVSQILGPRSVAAAAMVALLAACGQKGPLLLPTGEAAAARATLPQTLNPAAAPPASGPASPVPRP